MYPEYRVQKLRNTSRTGFESHKCLREKMVVSLEPDLHLDRDDSAEPLACLRFPSSEAGSAVSSLRIVPKSLRKGFPPLAAHGNHWDWKRRTVDWLFFHCSACSLDVQRGPAPGDSSMHTDSS